MTPSEFAAKWSQSTIKERAGSQSHFADLCRMLDEPTPTDADPDGEWYAFEKGAEKTAGGDGWADVWKRGHFAWEYKGKRKDLAAAYKQLLDYREALENPPLLVVCDMEKFEVHTNWTNTAKVVHKFDLAQLATDPAEPLRVLRAVLTNPDALRPTKTREEITRQAAEEYAALAISIRERGHDPLAVAHFLNKLLFVMFAEDSTLLPAGLLGRLLDATRTDPHRFADGLSDLFGKMSHEGGLFGTDMIQWFNGGLFDGPDVIPLTADETKILRRVSNLDWSNVEPAVFGTLFERGLDPSKRSQLGAHYTDRASIEKVVKPVVIAPLRREFEAMQSRVAAIGPRRRVTARTPLANSPPKQLAAFLDRLRSVTVLDPACGSGNFLYVALQELKDLEREAILWGSEEIGIPTQRPEVGPEAVKGIELNLYAAEIARVVVWIGQIQWMRDKGFGYNTNPILQPLHNIECQDALLDWGGAAPPAVDDETASVHPTEAAWPGATYIVGNPPFIGDKLMRRYLGSGYVDELNRVFMGRVPGGADFVTYWHEKARALVEGGTTERVGLLATQGIRGGANRHVLDRIKASGDIFMAWSDEAWTVDGATVHVSIIGFDDGSETKRTLDGETVPFINANLTAGVDLTQAKRLASNKGQAFIGDQKGGPFDIPASLAETMLAAHNPDGRSNADVLRPWLNGSDITGRTVKRWIIDFGPSMPITEAALYERPFAYVEEHVKPGRIGLRRANHARLWWIHQEARPGMRRALANLPRFIMTPRVSKHRIFVWAEPAVLPDSATVAIARSDDYSFGVLHSRPHELWARGMGTQLREAESGFRYTPRSTFETFPLPQASDEQRAQISSIAAELDERRTGWLDLAAASDEQLEERTLTNLYNKPPAWLRQLHERLDAAVLEAYGLPSSVADQDLLATLLEMNLGTSVA